MASKKTNLVCILLIILCYACNVDNKQLKENDNSCGIILKDYFNREIAIDSNIHKVLPMYYGECEIIVALGAKQKIVGIGKLPYTSDLSYSKILFNFFPNIGDLPIIGDAPINTEKLTKLNPDIVIGDNRMDIINQIDILNIKTFSVFPKNVGDIIYSIHNIGKIVNKEENSIVIANMLESIIDRVRIKTDSLKVKPSVYYVWSDLLTSVNDTVHNEIFEICGTTNVLKNKAASSYALNVSIESLYKWNPDYIIIRDRSPLLVTDILNDKSLKHLKAVKNKNVYKEHLGWRGYRMETFFGILEKSKWFHKDLFRDINIENEYQNFMNTIEIFNHQ